MSVVTTLQEFLDTRQVTYEVIEHTHTRSSMQTAESAHVPGDQLAKAILLGDEHGYLLAVIPATHRLEVARLNELTARNLELLGEQEIELTFGDCEVGAIPAVGEAYGIETVVDASLTRQDTVYVESGDHKHLIRLTGREFQALMQDAQRVQVSHHL